MTKVDGNTHTTVIGCNKKQMYVEIPFIRSLTTELMKKFQHWSNKLRPELDIRFFYKPPPSTQVFFQTKDSIVKHMISDVVYSIKCCDYEHSYIGKTECQCIRRLIEHGAPRTTFQQQQSSHDNDDRINNNLRHSSRIHNNIK